LGEAGFDRLKCGLGCVAAVGTGGAEEGGYD